MKHLTTLLFSLIIAFSFSQNRPQEPKAPFSYTSEEVTFVNTYANNIKFSGTLTLPKDVSKPPVAILISGSGPQNRNEELANHKPFLVISDYLTNNGIAVLRYDDRGTAKSEGDFNTASSYDFSLDAEAAVAYLKSRNDVDTNKIGLIGHSEGGLIAPMIASRNKDIAFIVLLAGTGVNGKTILETQTRRGAELAGAPKAALDANEALTNIIYGVVVKYSNFEMIQTEIKTGLNNYKIQNPDALYSNLINDTFINQQINAIKPIWLQYFIRTDPKEFLSKTHCPVLALNGSKDIQVLPKLNLDAIETGLKLAKNEDVTIKELEGLNHLFQTAETGSGSEYATIEETFSPKTLEIIKNWILERF